MNEIEQARADKAMNGLILNFTKRMMEDNPGCIPMTNAEGRIIARIYPGEEGFFDHANTFGDRLCVPMSEREKEFARLVLELTNLVRPTNRATEAVLAKVTHRLRIMNDAPTGFNGVFVTGGIDITEFAKRRGETRQEFIDRENAVYRERHGD